jgi:hypothetical protein
MIRVHLRRKATRPDRRLALLFTFFTMLLALGAFQPGRVQADAGPFPTRTPTVTLTPERTTTLTPTFTQTPTITLIPTNTQVVLEQEEQPLPVTGPTPSPPSPGNSLFACWPIALIFILAVIIASTYLLTRRAQPAE